MACLCVWREATGEVERIQLSPLLENEPIIALCIDEQNPLYIGTNTKGIFLYDENLQLLSHLTRNTVPAISHNSFTSILEDSRHQIWIGTLSAGINKWNIEGNTVIHFSTVNSGFLSFAPYQLIQNQHIPPVVLTDLSVNNQLIRPHGYNQILNNVINDTDEIVLRYNQSNFSIAYCGLNYIYHEQNQYAYKLIGHDEDWNYVGTRKEVFYTNIAPGRYTFQVIASNNDNVWNNTGKSLRIRILPPWWKTPLAYISCLILFCAITIVLSYYMHSKRKLEENLRIKQMERQQLEEFHQTKVRLFTNFSYELRTPLTLIISPLEELLKQVEVFPVIKQKLELVFKNSQRLLLLVNQLMDLQKNQAGRLKLKVSHSDMNVFFSEMYLAFKQIADKNQLEFHYNGPQKELQAYFDTNLLEKVVFNLLSNAFKFTKVGDAVNMTLNSLTAEELKQTYDKLRIEGTTLGKAEDYILIRVSDTGKGIPKKDQMHIFTPFYQVETNETVNNGTGIGLSLVQSIVRLHHGTIDMQNNLPRGTVFTIILPNDKSAYSDEELAPDTETPLFMEENTNQSLSESIPSMSNKKILIVEDNHEIRHYLRTSLESHYQIIESDNGTDAFDLVMKEFPDLVLSDIMMPGTDGLELCAMIKNEMQTCHIPVILLTARTMVMHIKEGYLSGAGDYIIKPFHTDVLLVRIHNLLTLREKLKSTYGKHFSLKAMGIDTTTSAED